MMVDPASLQFYDKYRQFEDPVSLEPIEEAVMDSHRHYFDQKTIEKLQAAHNNEGITCPKNRQFVPADQLQRAPDFDEAHRDMRELFTKNAKLEEVNNKLSDKNADLEEVNNQFFAENAALKKEVNDLQSQSQEQGKSIEDLRQDVTMSKWFTVFSVAISGSLYLYTQFKFK